MYGDYVSVADQRKKAEREIKKLKRIGFQPHPVPAFKGKIAESFWGSRWCDNLEKFEDMNYRAERGRRYVRAGCVCHLDMGPGRITAFVSGSELYFVEISVAAMDKKLWRDLCQKCSWEISSMADLYKGEIPARAIALLTDPDNGILPSVEDVNFACSCPDWSDMCKHSAATLYAVGRKLDEHPELLFKLRGVDPTDLVQFQIKIPENLTTIPSSNLKAIFGIDLDLPQPKPENAIQSNLPVAKLEPAVFPISAQTPNIHNAVANEAVVPYELKPANAVVQKTDSAQTMPAKTGIKKLTPAKKAIIEKSAKAAAAKAKATNATTTSKTPIGAPVGAVLTKICAQPVKTPVRSSKAAKGAIKTSTPAVGSAKPAAKTDRQAAKIFNPQHPTGKSIRALRIHAMLSLEGMARELGVSVGTITRWEGAPVPALKADSIQKLEKFQNEYMAEMAQ